MRFSLVLTGLKTLFSRSSKNQENFSLHIPEWYMSGEKVLAHRSRPTIFVRILPNRDTGTLIAQSINAFLNNNGGIIYVGVNSHDDFGYVAGEKLAQVKKLRREINRALLGFFPAVATSLVTLEIVPVLNTKPPQSVLVVNVKPGKHPVYFYGGLPYISENGQLMSYPEIEYRIKRKPSVYENIEDVLEREAECRREEDYDSESSSDSSSDSSSSEEPSDDEPEEVEEVTSQPSPYKCENIEDDPSDSSDAEDVYDHINWFHDLTRAMSFETGLSFSDSDADSDDESDSDGESDSDSESSFDEEEENSKKRKHKLVQKPRSRRRYYIS